MPIETLEEYRDLYGVEVEQLTTVSPTTAAVVSISWVETTKSAEQQVITRTITTTTTTATTKATTTTTNQIDSTSGFVSESSAPSVLAFVLIGAGVLIVVIIVISVAVWFVKKNAKSHSKENTIEMDKVHAGTHLATEGAHPAAERKPPAGGGECTYFIVCLTLLNFAFNRRNAASPQ